ncbi:MAG: nucleoside hydrolase [Anaerolineae bacterium]|nr:nucleoside hydrolase [Anaerolineae bacterium]
MAQRIIIDTDPGVDDTMAIFFALRSPELDVIGLTTIFGNVDTDLATTNALRLLEIAERTDIPVVKGADHPLAGSFGGGVAFVHGDDGQGNLHLPPPAGQARPGSAAEFIVEQVMAAPGEITLVPLGPLTNVALALRLEPRIAVNVRQVVLMGGNALCPGNATPAAEANIHNDPEAADVVFGAEWPVTMVGLDVTHRVHLTPAHLDRYAQADNPLARHISRIVPHYRAYFEQSYGIQGIYVHDFRRRWPAPSIRHCSPRSAGRCASRRRASAAARPGPATASARWRPGRAARW